MKAFGILVTLGCSILGLSLATPWSSARAGDFYQGKTLELIVSEGVGGGSDTMSRLVSRHLAKHLPGNPTVIVRNMPGAGGLAGTNYLYNIAARDGTSIGMIEQSIFAIQLFHLPGLKADVRKFNWLGRVISNNAVLIVWHTHPVKTIKDALHTQLAVSATGQSSQMRWNMLKRLIGVKFKLIVGLQGSAQAALAMERGDVDAFSVPWVVFRVAHADWLRDRKVNIILQSGLKPAPDLPNVPRYVDLASNDEQRRILALFSQPDAIGRSFVAPPGVPAERVAELRAAFTATFKDPEFLAETKSLKLTPDTLDGEALQRFIMKSFDYPPALIAKAEALAKPE